MDSHTLPKQLLGNHLTWCLTVTCNLCSLWTSYNFKLLYVFLDLVSNVGSHYVPLWFLAFIRLLHCVLVPLLALI